jgi:methyl-accepting chemotaxis protein
MFKSKAPISTHRLYHPVYRIREIMERILKSTILNSVQNKFALWAGSCLLLLSIILIAYAVVMQRSNAINTAKIQALAQANNEANALKTEIGVALDSARTLANSFAGMKIDAMEIPRNQVNAMLRQVLSQNPSFLRVYTIWEPNTLGETRRFIPSWEWVDGQIFYESLTNYEAIESSDYYQIPKNTHQEAIIDPYLHSIKGEDVLITSLVVPIIAYDTFYGIAGVDIPLESLQQRADEFTAFDGSAKIVLISHNGTIAGATGQPETSGQPLSVIDPNWKHFNSMVG